MNDTAQKMMEHWIIGKWGESWMQPLIFLNAICWLLLSLSVPAMIVEFLWGCLTGNAAPINFVLKVMFWAGIASFSTVAAGYLFSYWLDLVRERREGKGKAITFKEIVGEELDFERWCD